MAAWRGQPLETEIDYADELDENVLDTVHLAGARVKQILKQLMGG